MKDISMRDIDGISLGHATDEAAATGCTVVLAEQGAVAGVDVRGGAPATRETDLLRPENLVQRVHAVVLSGGSAFGLDAASGVMEYLETRGVGFDAGVARVPIVCGASLFDLDLGDAFVRPGREMGLVACGQAGMPGADDVLEGNVGAGTGCSVGKMQGMERASKGGVGMAGIEVDGLQVAAVVACNAFGNVVAKNGAVLAGVRDESGEPVPHEQMLLGMHEAFARLSEHAGDWDGGPVRNTTIGCIATNASLTKAQATKVASMAHDGYAHAVDPVHTVNDGDALFALATGRVEASPVEVGVLAVRVVEAAIRRGVLAARTAYGLPGLAS